MNIRCSALGYRGEGMKIPPQPPKIQVVHPSLDTDNGGPEKDDEHRFMWQTQGLIFLVDWLAT